MNEAEIRGMIADVLGAIAPEADFASLGNDDDIRETFDLDSMDFINFVIALHERTGRDIPEADYAQLRTLNGALAYFG
jgi:acyl carrier protein